MKCSGKVWTLVFIISTKNQGASIKGAQNFVFQFPGAEGGMAKI